MFFSSYGLFSQNSSILKWSLVTFMFSPRVFPSHSSDTKEQDFYIYQTRSPIRQRERGGGIPCSEDFVLTPSSASKPVRLLYTKKLFLLFTILWHIPLIWNQLVEELDVLSFNTCPRQDWNPSPPPFIPPSFTPWPSFHLIILFNIFQLNMIDHSHWPGNTGLLKFSWKYRIANID